MSNDTHARNPATDSGNVPTSAQGKSGVTPREDYQALIDAATAPGRKFATREAGQILATTIAQYDRMELRNLLTARMREDYLDSMRELATSITEMIGQPTSATPAAQDAQPGCPPAVTIAVNAAARPQGAYTQSFTGVCHVCMTEDALEPVAGTDANPVMLCAGCRTDTAFVSRLQARYGSLTSAMKGTK